MTDAWDARESREVTLKQRISPTREVVTRRTVYVDTILIDRMHNAGQVTDREHNAGCRLYGLFLAAGQGPRTTARNDAVREDVDDVVDAISDGAPLIDALTAYRRVLRHAGPLFGPLLDAMMRDQHPGVARLATARAALESLADQWGMEK
jgi:hypothetical protein